MRAGRSVHPKPRRCPWRWLVLPLCLAGCTSPERSPFVDVDWTDEMDRADRHPPRDIPPPPTFGTADEAPLFVLPPDGPVELTVEQATVLALRRNRDLAVQQQNPVIVGLFERIERGRFDPELFAELRYNEESAQEISRATGEQFNVDAESVVGSGGVRQNLPTGTDIELGVVQSRDISNRNPEQQEARVGLSVTQALLRGAGAPVNLVTLRQAELDTRASRHEFRGYAEALLADVESAYWNVVLAQRRIDVFDNALDLARQQLREAETRIEVGALAESDAAVVRAEVALREQALIDARSDLASQRLRLLRLLDAGGSGDLPDRLRLTSSALPEGEHPSPLGDLAQRVELARARRADLAEARLRLEQDRLQTIVTRNGLLPRLDLFINVGKTGFADSFSDSFRELDGDNYDLSVGVGVSQFLGNEVAQAQNAIAYATRQQSALAVANLEQLVELDVRLAATEAERARQQIAASHATARFQEEVARAERERFAAGTSTALLVAQSQRDLLEARITQTDATVAYRLALIQLYLAEGTLLERRGVSLNNR